MPRYVIRSPSRGGAGQLNLGDLNDEQRAAVLCPGGPVLVIAGAGSGKTRTLTYRAGHLINSGTDPDRVLLCTFTNRAARVMVERVEQLLGVDLRRLWAGTFHHVANLALRRYGELVGLPERYSILDREDAQDLLGGCLAEETAALRSRRFPSAAVVQQIASLAANSLKPIPETLALRAPRFYDLGEELSRVVQRYAQRKLQLGLVDYDDMLLFFKNLLVDHPRAAQELGERFEHVLVDEFQDTTRLQGEIVDLCARTHGNLMVVGDDAQSIYSFRGAHFQNILDFPKRYPGAQIFKLERNYRSSPEVLALANASIAVNTLQHPKVLRPSRPTGMVPAVLPLHDVYQQANFVAQRVLELSQEEGFSLREIAVLYRAHAHSLELQVELARRKIPYAVRSGLRFFEQAHIKDVVAYLRLLHNSGDTLAWQRVLKLWRGAGPRTADRLLAKTAGSRAPAAELLASRELREALPAGARPAIGQLAALLAQLDPQASPGDAIRAVVEAHYREYAQANFANGAVRVEDLLQLADFAARYETLERFLSELALVAGVAAEAIGPGELPEEKLVLSTVHQAKGLEWQSVFIVGLAEGLFPQAMAARSLAELEEERRLFHVAVTRARDQLYLCYPRFNESGYGPTRLLRLSRFLAELSPAPFERWEIEETDEAPTAADGGDDDASRSPD